MAAVLNRTTLEYHTSVNTPDYPISDWIHNPVMSAVAGIPTKRWVVESEIVRAMTDAENDVANLAAEKKDKTAAIDTRTDQLIALGFTYVSKQFSLSIPAQSKMIGTHQVKDDPALVYPINWNTIDDLDVRAIVDATDLDAFYLTGLGTIRGHLDGGTSLKDSVRAAITIAAVQTVMDNR